MVSFRELAKELLTNPELLAKGVPLETIPLSEVRLLSEEEAARLEEHVEDLGDLVKNWDKLFSISRSTKIRRLTLEKICSTATLLMEQIRTRKFTVKSPDTGSSQPYIKILFVGLAGAGKTTIINYLKRTEPLKVVSEAAVTSPRPTIGFYQAKLSLNEIPILLTELAGQDSFRKSFLDNPKKYFTDAQAIVFVIDGKDPQRFDQSLSFLKELYELLWEKQSSLFNWGFFPAFYFAVHKMDEGETLAGPMIGDLTDRISRLLPNRTILNTIEDIHSTTICNGYTISSFFGRVLEKFIPFKKYVQEGLQTMSLIYNFEFSCLINPVIGRLPLGWQSSTLEPKKVIAKIIEFFEKGELDKPVLTIDTGNLIREIHIMKLKLLKQEYYYIYILGDAEIPDEVFRSEDKIRELAIRALEPEIRFIQLALNPKAFDV
ncbi:MAG TPA: ADP-ribosylation factor-like protein [Candidatus Hodarchaeales archaeon]|nr:ADP-ribosylation factor-like protein [Candidatus Hodarchaeales archaeon]